MRLQEIVDQRIEENKMLWFAQGNTQGNTQGFDKGMAQGFDKGSRDTKIATARALLAMGLSVQQVAQGTGLPIDEVRTLL